MSLARASFMSIGLAVLASCQATAASAPQRPIAAPAVVAPPAIPRPEVAATEAQDAPPACEPIAPSAYDIGPLDPTLAGTEVPLPAIVDGSHDLDAFYARLAELVRGKAKDHVRIAVYGDSNMTMDYITGAMRRLFQAKFGDGGHGYVAMARPWNWYHHMDVVQKLDERAWRRISTSTNHVRDGNYSAANVATETSRAGAWSLVGTSTRGPIGGKVSSFDVFYLKRPRGGSFAVSIDGEHVRDVDARSGDTTTAFAHFDVPDGPHQLKVTVKRGVVRLFGAALERKPASVIVDSLGTGALNYEQMLHVSDASRRPMLARRHYDLVIFLLGTNLFAPKMHERWMKRVVSDIESAVPGTSILILSPPDLEKHKTDEHTDPRIVTIDAQFADIAARNGWAFWSFWKAMGGDESMIHFAHAGLASWDLVHLGRHGGMLMGDRLAHALVDGFAAYVRAHPDAGCPDE
jgi:lysophospholipase L1-like esterase